jgi:dihydrofolate synthase / folylpolyglutamate synthase
MNSAIAIATIDTLQNQGWQISETAIQNGIAKTQWAGRLQQTTWKNQTILIDGAHNPAAAIALREYVDNLSNYQPINWVIGIIATKDCDDILTALLKKGDRLYIVPVPDQNSTPPAELATLAQNICPKLTLCQTFPDLTTALDDAVADGNLTVICGSLYLIGYFLQQQTSPLDPR